MPPITMQGYCWRNYWSMQTTIQRRPPCCGTDLSLHLEIAVYPWRWHGFKLQMRPKGKHLQPLSKVCPTQATTPNTTRLLPLLCKPRAVMTRRPNITSRPCVAIPPCPVGLWVPAYRYKQETRCAMPRKPSSEPSIQGSFLWRWRSSQGSS